MGNFTGTSGDDVWTGTDADESADGGAGNDTLSGGGGDDTLDGGDGNDTLTGDAGADVLRGGAGDDRYFVDEFDTVEEVDGGGTRDWIWSTASWTLGPNFELLLLQGSANLNGTGNELQNEIRGTSGSNILQGLGGRDYLIGFDGNDFLYGGEGDGDTLYGGGGDDLIDGGPGDGDIAAYWAWAFAGVTIDLSIVGPQDTVGAGFDTIVGIETVGGTTWADILKGDDGTNDLYGGSGGDWMEGRGGNDAYSVDDPLDMVVEEVDGGRDHVSSSISYTLPENVEDLYLNSSTSGVMTGRGNVLNNVIGGAAFASNTLYGGGGNDTISGNALDDILYGEDGDDQLNGLGANDSLFGDAGDDVLSGGEGEDTLSGADGTDTIHGDAGNDSISGGAGSDYLYGDAGDDIISGGDDSDYINGGEGNDTLDGGAGIDELEFKLDWPSSSGSVTVDLNIAGPQDFGAYGVDTIAGFENIRGTYYADNLYGTDGANTFYSVGGADWLEGRGGDDIYIVQHYATKIVEQADGGFDTVYSFTDFTLPTYVEALYLHDSYPAAVHVGRGSDSDNWLYGAPTETNQLYGEGGMDVLVGGSGTDILVGGDGNDQLFGQYGNDTLYDDHGADVLDGGAGTDTFYVDLGRGFSTADQIVGGAEHDTLYIAGGHHDDWLDLSSFSITEIESFVSLTGSFRMSVEAASSFPRIEIWGLELTNAGTFVAGENFKVWDIRLSDAGNSLDLSNAAPLDYVVTGGDGNDTITSSVLGDTITGGGGADLIRGTASQLNGDTIIGFDRGDVLLFTDASIDSFNYSLADNIFYFSGGSLTLSGSGSGSLIVSAAATGGVQVRMGPLDDYDALNDFNGDGRSDLFWRNGAGTASDWLGQANGGFVGNGASSLAVGLDWHVQGYGDFNGDGRDDVLWRNDGGTVAYWYGMKDGGFEGNDSLYMTVSDQWHIVGTGDFNGDGRDDVLWRGNNGIVTDWLGQASGAFVSNNGSVFNPAGLEWHIVGTGDFNGDGRDDVLWRNDAGTIANWLGQPDGGFVGNPNLYTTIIGDWQVVCIGDFNGDGRDDVAMRSDGGVVTDWLGQTNGSLTNNAHLNAPVGGYWHAVAVGDYNGDGRDDILWRHDNGTVTDWLGQKDGGFVGNGDNLYMPVGTDWHLQPQDVLML